MKRNAETDLKNWYTAKNRKPLILRGARQVGKSTLVRNFAKSNNLELIEINFEKVQLKSPDETLDLEVVLPEIEYVSKKKFGPKSLLFLDEIQDAPKMITGLRFFKEDRPDLAVIAAGSLLEFALTLHEISIPVGRVQYYHLGPFTFSEFLNGIGEHAMAEFATSPKKIPAYAEKALRELYQKYLFIGGMPEAIKTYIDNHGQWDKIRATQDSILQSFRDDFHKYSTRAELPRVRKVFDSITRIAGHKVKYTQIDSEEKSRDLKCALDLLFYARVFLPVFHSNGTSIPLRAYEDSTIFKTYFLDVGLLGCLHRLDWYHLTEENPLSGVMAEQFVAQHLMGFCGPFLQPELHYWLNDKKSHRAEVDFLIETESQIYPIEVKAGSGGQLKSLLYFWAQHKKTKQAIHLGLHSFNVKQMDCLIPYGNTSMTVKGQLIQMPLYLIDYLKFYLTLKKHQ